ncbi:MAG: hypothetical protein GKS06_11055 [Acidobacteria bacterium]|nr:hypothetical protein [Acidobacteriota bacterium]
MSRLCLSAGLVLFVLASSAAPQAPGVVVDVEHDGRDVTVWVNGVPVSHSAVGMSPHRLELQPFLMNGANEVRIEWRRMQEEARALSAAVQLIGVEGDVELASISGISDDTIGGTYGQTLHFAQAFDRPWAWTRAPIVELNDDDREQIGSAVLAFHSAYESGDASQAAELTRQMWTELAGHDETAADRMRRRYEEHMASPDWDVAPLAREELRFESFGRLVRVWRNGQLIRVAGESRPRLSLDGLYLAKIDGTWTIARPVT